MQKAHRSSIFNHFACIVLVVLTLLHPNALLAQPKEPEVRSPPLTRFALESAAGLGVWAGAAAAGGLLVWGMSYTDCPDDPNAPHACPAATLATFGVILLIGAAFVVTPITVKAVGNSQGTFGSALISGLVGVAAASLLSQLYPQLGLPATLALIPVANVLGNVITFELTHTSPPPPAINGVTANNFKLQPGIGISFRF